MRPFLPVLLLFLLPVFSPAQSITYITPQGAGAMNGTSWANAMSGTMLRTAVRTAPAPAGSARQIWVAAGTYTSHASSRDSSFNIVSGVEVYGGFAGTETALSQRSWTANVTVLSGDIGVAGDSTDNSYHVVSFNNVTGAVVDGFTIRGGNASDQTGWDGMGGGVYQMCQGAAWDVSVSKVRNCRITRNSAYFFGGGVYTTAIGGNATMFMENCEVTDNSSTNHGGGVAAQGREPSYNFGTFYGFGGAMLHVRSTVFANNRAGSAANTSGYGGAICLFTDGSDLHASIRNCEFISNISGYSGGAISNYMSAPMEAAPATLGVGSLLIDSCRFEHNRSGSGHGNAIDNNGRRRTTARVRISHSEFTGNRAVDSNRLNRAVALKSVAKDQRDSILNCRFYNNANLATDYQKVTIVSESGEAGSTVQGPFIAYRDTLVVANCLFHNNNRGQELFTYAVDGVKHILLFTNNTVFHDSTSTSRLMTIENYAGATSSTVGTGTEARVYVANSILWHTLPSYAQPSWQYEIQNTYSASTLPASSAYSHVSNSMLQGTAQSWPAAYGVNGGGNLSVKPKFMDTGVRNFYLVCNTPGVNAGANAAYALPAAFTNCDGRPRITATIIDMGAFETYAMLPVARPVRTLTGQTMQFYTTNYADSLRWTFGDGTSSTSASGTHAYSQYGTFSVCLRIYNGCGQDDSCFTVTLQSPAGIAEAIGKPLRIWPNPAHDALQMDAPEAGRLELYSITGRRVLEADYTGQPGYSLQLPQLSPGVYLLRLSGKDGTPYAGRVVIE